MSESHADIIVVLKDYFDGFYNGDIAAPRAT
jgi:hypothetical protein